MGENHDQPENYGTVEDFCEGYGGVGQSRGRKSQNGSHGGGGLRVEMAILAQKKEERNHLGSRQEDVQGQSDLEDIGGVVEEVSNR